MYRAGETKWTQGAYLRGARRNKCTVINLGKGQMTLGRASDVGARPVPIKRIIQRMGLQLYQPHELLTGATLKGRQLLVDRRWEAEEVEAEEIPEELRGRKDVFEPFSLTDVKFCTNTMVDIVKGTHSEEILRRLNPLLSTSHIDEVTLRADGFSFHVRETIADAVYDDHCSANIKPPASIAEALKQMRLSVGFDCSFGVEILMQEQYHEEIFHVLENLRVVLYRAQKLVDRFKKGFTYYLPALAVTLYFDSQTLQVNRLFLHSAHGPRLTVFGAAVTPEELSKPIT